MAIDSIDELCEIVGTPSELVVRKQLDRLDRHAVAFIAAAPFAVVASSGADGRSDATPRGDPPGFIRVLDDRTLLIPDRRGNRRVDTMRNVLETGHVGLLIMIPGKNETLRVNGRAELVSDPDLLAPLAVDGKAPQLGILVHIDEVFFHCARALLRSKLWQPASWTPDLGLATLGEAFAEETGVATASELDEDLESSNRDLY